MHEDTLPETGRLLGAESSRATREVEEEVVRLFGELRVPILRYVGTMGLPRGEGEDITQDAFVALFRHLTAGKSRENLRAWLFRVAHNLALKRLQVLRNQGEMPAEWESAADESASPEEQAAFGEQRRAVLGVIRALKAEDRQCLALRAEGLTYREIAGTVGISLGSVANSLARTLDRIGRATRGGK
jgi:RNA polymerase sigma-70 factor, ECF subfamily